MEWFGKPHYAKSLVDIGLVLVGLLGGILAMMIAGGPGRSKHTEFRLVEQVDVYEAANDSLQTAGISRAMEWNELFKDVAGRVTQSVVSIEAESSWRDFLRDRFQGFEGKDSGDRSLREFPRESVGSGVVFSPQGYIVTNHHVVDNASRLRVTFTNKAEYDARVVGVDASTDLAVLRIDLEEGEEIPAIALGNSDEVVAGEWVMAVGNPFRLTSTVTAGIVSALGRQVDVIDERFDIEDFIQTDAAINPGNSGGALVNLRGELIGISTAIATESGAYEGYGFAIPASLAKRIAQDLIAYGEVRRGYLGVGLQDVDAVRANWLGLDRIRGVFLEAVKKGGAADKGGLREGDVILSVDGKIVNATNELQSAVALRRPGDHVAMEIWRKGETTQLVVQLLGQDDPAIGDWLASLGGTRRPVEGHSIHGGGYHLEPWGLIVRELEPWETAAYGAEAGVYVSYVLGNTVTGEAGLPHGVVLDKINDRPLRSVEDMVRVLNDASDQGEPVIFSVRRRSGLSTRIEIVPPGD